MLIANRRGVDKIKLKKELWAWRKFVKKEGEKVGAKKKKR